MNLPSPVVSRDAARATHLSLIQDSPPPLATFADDHGYFAPPSDPLAVADELANTLARTAVQRDRIGGHPAQERELLRTCGLLTLSIPREYGGGGASWSTVYQVIRRLAQADSAVAHLYGFHHLQIAGVLLYGNAPQRTRHLVATVNHGLFWGNALNPLDRRTTAVESEEGYSIDGIKSFSSGSVGSDMLTFSAWHEATQSNLIGTVRTRHPGVTVLQDWDAFGQKQTDSGTVRFEGVDLPPANLLQAPGVIPTPFATLRSCVAQLSMTNLYLGIAQGALQAARTYTIEQARPWFAAGVETAVDDPFVQRQYGEFVLKVSPAQALADLAAQALDDAFAKGELVTAQDRARVAVAIAQAKVLSHRAALEVASGLFEVSGARATSDRYGLDRFWRNARVHTLHDPVEYKLRDIGRYALSGRAPDPTPYS
jgi:alkylation response protein AidB-like acyl-CoA dehydrogenase